MTDIVSKEKRSRMMSGIRSKNTKPELLIRKGLHRRGLRYRLHKKDLPGKPDIVFVSRQAVIFVHGCFWHSHDCHLFKVPSTRTEWWLTKLAQNRRRDTNVKTALEDLGWRHLVIWECAIKGRHKQPLDRVVERAAIWLLDDDTNAEIRGE